MAVAVHCQSCASKFEIERPQGQIVFNQEEDKYHFYPTSNWQKNIKLTECGLDETTFSSMLGIHGIELSEDSLCHNWLRGLEACHKCFANVW